MFSSFDKQIKPRFNNGEFNKYAFKEKDFPHIKKSFNLKSINWIHQPKTEARIYHDCALQTLFYLIKVDPTNCAAKLQTIFMEYQ